MELKFIYANCTGNAGNSMYPNTAIVHSKDELHKYMKYDYTFIEYKNNHRCGKDFIRSVYATFDVDNTTTDDSSKWIQIEDIPKIFPNVWCLVVTSTNHMKVKNGRSPRPKFHIVFRINEITTAQGYYDFMHRVYDRFNFFDPKALDAGRFMFGCEKFESFIFEGKLNLTEFMDKEEENDAKFMNLDYENLPEIVEGSRNATMSKIAGRILKRFGDNQTAYEHFLKHSDRCLPPLDNKELETIWQSAKKFYAVISSKPNYISPEKYGEPIWEQPLPLEIEKTPPFPIEALPGVIRKYVEELSVATQTPIDMAASSALAILAVCCQNKYKIKGKQDWYEPLNLYSVIIAEPSERKSAIISAMVKPLLEYEKKYNFENSKLIELSRSEKKALERQRMIIETNLSKGKCEKKELEEIIDKINDFEEKHPLKLYVDDITTEKLNQVLYENKGKASIISSEGGIFDILAGMYSKNVNMDVFLKGYSGDSIRVDRMGRDSTIINDPRLSILLTVQPSVLKGLIKNEIYRGRGLTARFMYTYPTSKVGDRVYRTKPISEFSYIDYANRIYNILDDEEEQIIKLSEDADILIEQFSNMLEPKLISEYKQIGDWAGKLVGNVLRIAGILARANVEFTHATLDDNEVPLVSKEIMQNAIKIGQYYLEHAKVSFSLMGSDAIVRDSIYVLDNIKKTGLKELSVRDLLRHNRTFKKKEDIMPVINHLVDTGYLMEVSVAANKMGRPTGIRYLVHPNVLKTA